MIKSRVSLGLQCCTPLLMALLAGCDTTGKGGAQASSGDAFIENAEEMTFDRSLPFDRVWYDKSRNWRELGKVYVAEVNTDYLKEAGWWDQVSYDGDREADAHKVARMLRERVTRAFAEDPNHTLRVVETPDDDTLVLHMALVDIVPTAAWLNMHSVVLDDSEECGTVAIEARVSRGLDGDTIAAFADRETAQGGLLTDQLTWYGHAEGIIDLWARSLQYIVNTTPEERLENSSPFGTRPW